MPLVLPSSLSHFSIFSREDEGNARKETEQIDDLFEVGCPCGSSTVRSTSLLSKKQMETIGFCEKQTEDTSVFAIYAM